MIVFLQFLTDIDLCQMTNPQKVYLIETAKACINAPLLTKEVFEQTQLSIEQLTQLYGFQKVANNPPEGYNDLKTNLSHELQALRQQFQGFVNISVYSYYSQLTKIFQKVKDSNTAFIKPNFFSNFKIYFPLQLVYQNNSFYLHNFQKNTSYYNITQSYKELHGDLNFSENDSIITINNTDPLLYLSSFAQNYVHSAKSAHARLNHLLQKQLYEMDLKNNNLLNDQDTELNIKFKSGKNLTVKFVVKIDTAVQNSSVAQQQFIKEVKTQSPYKSNNIDTTDKQQTETSIPSKTVGRKLFTNLKLLLSSENYFNLYTAENNDLLLQLIDLSCTNQLQALNDTILLLNKIKSLIANHKLFVSVISTGGNNTNRANLLVNGLSHSNYPIYSKQNVLKSKLYEILLKGGSQLTNFHRVHPPQANF